eukprot:5117191-Pleurochrysis_carterae.AAC.1
MSAFGAAAEASRVGAEASRVGSGVYSKGRWGIANEAKRRGSLALGREGVGAMGVAQGVGARRLWVCGVRRR